MMTHDMQIVNLYVGFGQHSIIFSVCVLVNDTIDYEATKTFFLSFRAGHFQADRHSNL